MTGIQVDLRQWQEGDPELGTFYARLYEFIDRTREAFFRHEYNAEPLPELTLSFEELRAGRVGEYRPKDGTLVPDVIVLDPHKLEDGWAAAEVIVHEMAHAWMKEVEEPDHSDQWRTCMAEMGIIANDAGRHVGYTDPDVWQQWMSACDDLELKAFKLPNDHKPPRRQIKYACPECGFSFHTRRSGQAVFCEGSDDNDDAHEPVQMVQQ